MNMADFAKNSMFFLMLIVAALCFTGGAALALTEDDRTPPSHNVSSTKHNLSTSGPGGWTSTNETEICIFCHTPHNAALNVPLWNHYSTDTAKTFKIYSSYNFSKIMEAGGGSLPFTIDSGSISLLCLTCHDGTTALNALVNFGTSGVRPGWGAERSFSDAPFLYDEGEGPYIGTNLVNMHPINFSYDEAKSGDPSGLRDITVPRDTNGLKFFGAGNNLECPTCHDPHIYTGWDESPAGDSWNPAAAVNAKDNFPFLRRSNASSMLCLSCHDK